jgi:hypothetical protein
VPEVQDAVGFIRVVARADGPWLIFTFVARLD